MAVSLEETISRQTYGPIGHLLSHQTFWVFAAAVVAFVCPSMATTTFDTSANLFNVARAIVRLSASSPSG